MYTKPFSQAVQQNIEAMKAQLPFLVTGIDDSARALYISQLFLANPQPILIVEPNSQKLTHLMSDLQRLLPDVEIYHFNIDESLAVEHSQASLDTRAERIQALDLLARQRPGIVVTSVAGVSKRLTPISAWKQALLNLQAGESYDNDDLITHLNYLGYQRQPLVERPGEYSIRGGIIDIYPLDRSHPIRLDFFDTELDSIREFDADTQTSLENIEEVCILPSQDILVSIQELQALIPQIKKHITQQVNRMQDAELAKIFKQGMMHQLELLEHGTPLKYYTNYLGWLDSKPTSILDYIPQQGHLIIHEYSKIPQIQDRMQQDNQYWLTQEVQKGQMIANVEPRLNAYDLLQKYDRSLTHISVMHRGLQGTRFYGVHHFQYRSLTPFLNQEDLMKSEFEHWLYQKFVIQIIVSDHRKMVAVEEQLRQLDIGPVVFEEGIQDYQSATIYLIQGQIQQGFELPVERYVLLSDSELFGKVKQRNLRRNHLSNAERIKSYNELKAGDYVVHISHGIGQYQGLETLEINGIHKDLLVIEYKDQARVMIPVDQIGLLQKYVGSEHKQPKVHKLGGTEWARTKQKVQSSIEDIADELIALYAQRQSEKGFAFSQDTPEQAEFENAFAYAETEDQLTSSQEIKQDMEKDRPMDRLLVGDVGYGKTEVAMRAIFKAVMEGKQVAFLVPTTILAQQHYHTLLERFQGWPFEIGLLSRFVPASQQKETLKQLAQGALSIIVGTHRILSKDVVFHDLGLLIVDEEQRFGVKHKERLKQLKAQVDVLTLTATPIPRTLHMSMIGVRDLSLIETPPSNRFPVQTYVMEQNDGVIKTGIERELERGGQVFYLYNRVSSIYQRALEIESLVPEARIAVAHGQMGEMELETVLLDFIEGAYDVLVTTTIIETGVDIPNANTLFIEDADKMGLSTLYQLRGRVGRTHRLAYAYLMYQPFKQLSEVSEKRLNAIREFTELGSGFKIAMRDLSIRGAGNLLGQQQSGYIDSVGYDMYSRMLEEAIARKQGKKVEKNISYSDALDWNISIEAYLPEEYIEDERQKIAIYQLIEKINSRDAYRNVQDQLIDRFGEFPDPVSNLLDIGLIRHFAQYAGVTHIDNDLRTLSVRFNRQASQLLAGPNIFQALQDVALKAQIQTNQQHLRVSFDIYKKDPDIWLSALATFTQACQDILKKEENHASR